MTSHSVLKIAGLETLHIPGPVTAATTVVMLHGYGANRQDLAPLHDLISVPGGAQWYFPNGPEALQFGGGWEGRAWFPIDMARLQSLMERGRQEDIPTLLTPGLFAARERLLAFLKALDVAPAQLIVAGFSQGALVAMETALSLPAPLRGVGLFSAIHLPGAQWDERMPRLATTPVFQSHGERDPVLPFIFAERLYQRLTAAGVSAAFYGFHGGHEIPAMALRRFSETLGAVEKPGLGVGQ